ncbi:hypothetical protein Tco_0434541 [Tanacetum coccineum]
MWPGVGIGLMAIGGMAIGAMDIGGMAIGLMAIGAMAIGGMAIGAMDIGGMAIGAMDIGGMAIGAMAIVLMGEEQPRGRRGHRGRYARGQLRPGADTDEEEPRPNRRDQQDLEIAAQGRQIRELERVLDWMISADGYCFSTS